MTKNNKHNLPEDSPASCDGTPVMDQSAEIDLDPKQLQAAQALAQGKTDSQTAQMLNINRSTLYRWRKQAPFVAEVNRLKQEDVAEYRSRRRDFFDAAMANLKSYLERDDSDPFKMKATFYVLRNFAPNPDEPSGPVRAEEIERQWNEGRAFDEILQSLQLSGMGTTQEK